MEKVFKAFISERVGAFLMNHGWRKAAPPKGNFIAGKGGLWKKVGPQGRATFIFCRIHENLNAVEAYLGWHVVDAFPPIDAVMENAATHVLDCRPEDALEAASALLCQAPQGWLRQHDLGLKDMFGLSVEVPPISRLASVFDNPANKREIEVGLLGSPDVDWRQAKAFHYWGIVDHFDTLTAEDAQVAAGGTCEALIDLLRSHYVPIADRFLNSA